MVMIQGLPKWKIAGKEEYVGSKAELEKLNRLSNNSFVINGNKATNVSEFTTNESNEMPSTLQTKKTTKKKKKKVVKKKRVTNIAALQNGKEITLQVREAEPESPMIMQSVVGQGELGYGSPSLIKTGETDPLSKMRKCQQEENEEGNVMPSVVAVEKKDEK